jgi:hypothetical protein
MSITDPITAAVDQQPLSAGSSIAAVAGSQLPALLEQAVVIEYICSTEENFITNLLVNASMLSQKQRTSNKSSSTTSSINKSGLTTEQQSILFSDLIKKDPDMASKLDKNKVLNLVIDLGKVDPPIGSILARIISKTDSSDYVILFPIFTHISMPISAGETVFFIRDRPGGGESTVGYWLARRPTKGSANNLNFTPQQSVDNATGGRIIDKNSSNEDSYKEVPNFNDGSGNDPGTVSLISSEPGSTIKSAAAVQSYSKIMDNSITTSFTINEATEKLKERPNDLTLEGANNAHVWIGMDRNGTIDLTDSCKDRGAGCIDVVAGKKLFSNIIENTRNFKEVDNRLGKRIPGAGDISLKDDKSRVRVVAKSSADKDFGIKYPAKTTKSLGGGKIEPVDKAPYIVFKSDEIRVLARDNGSIKIIKDGTTPGTAGGTYSAIIMHPDGSIQIDAEKIVFGRNDSNANGFVRYSKYKKQMDDLLQKLDTLLGHMSTNFTPGTNVTPAGGPNAGLTALKAFVDTTKTDLSTLKGTISQARSTAIFGE